MNSPLSVLCSQCIQTYRSSWHEIISILYILYMYLWWELENKVKKWSYENKALNKEERESLLNYMLICYSLFWSEVNMWKYQILQQFCGAIIFCMESKIPFILGVKNLMSICTKMNLSTHVEVHLYGFNLAIIYSTITESFPITIFSNLKVVD